MIVVPSALAELSNVLNLSNFRSTLLWSLEENGTIVDNCGGFLNDYNLRASFSAILRICSNRVQLATRAEASCEDMDVKSQRSRKLNAE